jgi:polar amino acid transport system substrate-binding protein
MFRRIALVLGVLFGGLAAPAQTEVTVYTYNDRTPFVVDQARKDGLEYRLCDWLTKESKGTYRFTLRVTTAADVRAKLDAGTLEGVLLGVNPVWFSEAERAKALWTPPILFDKNVVISLGSRKIDFKGPESLAGLRVALVKDWFYPEIGAAFTALKAQRVDFGSEPLALRGMAAGKADVALVSEWTFLYEQLRGDLAGDFFTADKPASTFERMILVPAARKALHADLVRYLTDIKKNPGWQEATSL